MEKQNIVNEILKNKIKEVKNLKKINCKRNKKVYNLKESLKHKPIIAEIKKSTPLKSFTDKNLNILKRAKNYERFGAGAISVLTDEKYFSGDIEELYEISKNVKIPILCKDFIISEMQIINAHISGADAILLIVSILEKEKINSLVNLARSLNLQILFEIHKLKEFDLIKEFDPALVGVNARNLKTLNIEILNASKTIEKLKEKYENLFIVAESGITDKEHIKLLKNSGADAFLIGSAFMESKNLSEKFNEFYEALKCS